MTYTAKQIADALDLAVLKPTATLDDLIKAGTLVKRHGIKSLCVAPCNVQYAVNMVPNVCAVIGFPHGNSLATTKLYEASEAMDDGAKELDVVINYGRFLDRCLSPMLNELHLIVPAAHSQGVLVKAILETAYYTTKQVTEACLLCVDHGVDFVKTSTGFAEGANQHVVETMVEAVRGRAQVKASGGIGCYADVAQYLDLGCTRIGSSKYLELLP
jgi:deoxyribose-phosphate aldolase